MSAACPACQSSDATVFVGSPVDREYFNVRSVPATVRQCSACRSLFQVPWPDADEVNGFYGADYQNYTTTSVPLLSQVNEFYQRRIGQAFINEFGREASVLDFGCGQGGFLQALADSGCRNLAGFDFVLYDELHSISNALFYNSLEKIHSSGVRFDVIRMRHVIEHLTDVDGTMLMLRSLLNANGRIIGQTPNAAHYTARLMGQYWGPLHYPYHTVLFSTGGLAAASRRWDLRLTRTAGSFLPSGWAISIENMYKQLSGSDTRGRTAGYTLLMALTLPLAVFDRLIAPRATANFDFVLAVA